RSRARAHAALPMACQPRRFTGHSLHRAGDIRGPAFWPNPLVVGLCVLVIGTRQHALFVIAHDAAHYLLYENRRLNDLVGRAAATVQGLSMCTYRVIHRLHHNNLYGALDPDTALHGGYSRGKGYLI